MMEFLVEIETRFGVGMGEAERAEMLASERERALELRATGNLTRIWRIPGRLANVAIWSADDATELHALLASLPLHPWQDVRVTALARHPAEDQLVQQIHV
jgi:muconolactone D-isomerase